MMDAEARFDRERAVGSLIHDCYTAMEAALERLIDAVDGDRPKGGDYHAQLIERAAAALAGLRPAIVSAETARDLHALRGFRHVMCATPMAASTMPVPRQTPRSQLAPFRASVKR